MGTRKARNARAREAREAEIREAREAQDREAREAQDRDAREAREAQCIREATARYARWKTFGVCTVLWSIGAAVLGFKSITSMLADLFLFCLLHFIIFLLIPRGEDRLLAGMLGMVLGIVGVSVLGLHNWVWSWILPIASFRVMENRKPVPMALLLGVERVVLIVGVAVLGWRSGLALDVIIIIVETETHSRWARSWLWQNGLAKWRRCTGFEMFEMMGDDGWAKRRYIYVSAPRDVWEIVACGILMAVFDMKLSINRILHRVWGVHSTVEYRSSSIRVLKHYLYACCHLFILLAAVRFATRAGSAVGRDAGYGTGDRRSVGTRVA